LSKINKYQKISFNSKNSEFKNFKIKVINYKKHQIKIIKLNIKNFKLLTLFSFKDKNKIIHSFLESGTLFKCQEDFYSTAQILANKNKNLDFIWFIMVLLTFGLLFQTCKKHGLLNKKEIKKKQL
jgi:hypothetical protein